MEIKMRIDNLGYTVWYKKGDYYYHREDGPAEYKGKMEFWWYYNVHYDAPRKMPLNLYLAYCKWEYRKIYGN